MFDEITILLSILVIVLLINTTLLRKQIKILEASYQILNASNKTIYTITTQNDRIIEAIENNTIILERSIEKKTSSRV